jgi:hypothetical protein
MRRDLKYRSRIEDEGGLDCNGRVQKSQSTTQHLL